MPRKDPVTGCMVMTMPEFLADEAKREGKGRSGGDILGDIMQEMAQADEEQAKRIESDPEGTWLEICELCNLSSVDVVQSWEYWMDDEEKYQQDLKNKFRRSWREDVHPSLKKSYNTLKNYAKYRQEQHDRTYKPEPRISKGEPHPVQMIRVLSAQTHSGFRDGSSQVESLVLCADGKKRVFSMSHWSSSGSMMEPPDSDFDFDWREPTREELGS